MPPFVGCAKYPKKYPQIEQTKFPAVEHANFDVERLLIFFLRFGRFRLATCAVARGHDVGVY